MTVTRIALNFPSPRSLADLRFSWTRLLTIHLPQSEASTAVMVCRASRRTAVSSLLLGFWARRSVGARKDGAVLCGLAAVDTFAGSCSAARPQNGVLVDRNAAHGGASLFFNFFFASAAAAPAGVGEAGLDGLFEFVVGLGVVRIRTAEGECLCMQGILNVGEELFHGCGQIGQRGKDFAFFSGTITARENSGLLGDILRAEFDAQRYAAHLPVIELPARALTFTLIERHANICFHELGFDFLSHGRDGSL